MVGNERKLTPSYVGPYEVIRVDHDGISYKIRDITDESIEYNVNVKLIKPYISKTNLFLSPIDRIYTMK